MDLTALLLFLTLGQAGEKPDASPEAKVSCGICHTDVVALRAKGGDVHEDLACADCHPGRGDNPHVPPAIDEETAQAASQFAPVAAYTPIPYTTCSDCHEVEVEAVQASVHGQHPGDPDNPQKPSCQSCHGTLHAVTAATQTKHDMAQRCVACHAFAEAGKVPTSPFVVDTYRDTIHGKMLHLGNDAAAACADCHTGHHVFAHTDPRASVHPSNVVQTCQKCHPGATASFATAVSHEPPRYDRNFWAWFTSLAFGVLTAGVIFLLFVHVVLDFLSMGRRAKERSPSHAKQGPVAADAPVERFDIHARIQHWGMMASFTTLVLTGWPLKMAHLEASNTLVRLFGGQATAAVIHRVAAVVLLAVAVYHVIYLVVRAKQGRLTLEMVPALKDVTDLAGNIAYYLGLKKERPRFGKWTYYEKFDYWAVFWGMAIMGGSGLILWFPTLAARILPGSFIAIAQLAHSDEALLAALAIFLWHFYNVHLKPTIFPMSWVWLTGKLTAEALYEEHREEYERRFGRQPPAAPAVAPTWHVKHIWSMIGVGVVILAGLGVILGNVRSVRDQIAALTAAEHGVPGEVDRGRPPGRPTQTPTPELLLATKVASAYDPGFDAFGRCLECHAREAYAKGAKDGLAFPHTAHFEEYGVDQDCKQCHVTVWHESIVTQTSLCLECHEAGDIGIREEEP